MQENKRLLWEHSQFFSLYDRQIRQEVLRTEANNLSLLQGLPALFLTLLLLSSLFLQVPLKLTLSPLLLL